MRWFWPKLGERNWIDRLPAAMLATVAAVVGLSSCRPEAKQPKRTVPDIFAISIDTSVAAESLLVNDEIITDDDSLAIFVSSISKPDKNGFVKVELILANPADQEFDYLGYVSHSFSPPLGIGTVSPIYVPQRLVDGVWQDRQGGWCGFGSTMIVLHPGRAGRFETHFQNVPGEVRVGVEFRKHQANPHGGVMSNAWSPPFTIPTDSEE